MNPPIKKSEWTIGSIYSNAWKNVSGMKASFWKAAVIAAAVALVLAIIESALKLTGATLLTPADYATLKAQSPMLAYHSGKEYFQLNPVMLAITFVFSIVTALYIQFPIKAGFVLMGLRRAAGNPIKMNYIFKFFHKAYLWRLVNFQLTILIAIAIYMIIGLVLMTLARATGPILPTFIGALLVVGLIYFCVSVSMGLALIIDRRVKPLDAIITSIKTINRVWFNVFAVILLTLIIVLLSIIPVGLGLIWSLPFSVNVTGSLYRELFGIEGKDPVTAQEQVYTSPT